MMLSGTFSSPHDSVELTKSRRPMLVVGWTVAWLVAQSLSVVAQEGLLRVYVTDLDGNGIEGVEIGPVWGGRSDHTDGVGRALIQLGSAAKPGGPVTLVIESAADDTEWVFVSPRAGRSTIPSFQDSPENYVAVARVAESEPSAPMDS